MGSRRIAAVHLRSLPVEVVFGAGEGPRAVRDELRGRPILIAVSAAARAAGVRAGMTPVEAKARLPELEIRPRDLGLEAKRLARAAELLLGFGPQVELGLPDVLAVEVGRSRRVLKKKHGDGELAIARGIEKVLAEVGHECSVAIAQDPDTARTFVLQLSRGIDGPAPARGRSKKSARPAKRPASPRSTILIVAPGEDRTALDRLPLDALRWTDPHDDPEGTLRERVASAIASLKLLGVVDVARMRSLPREQLASRFGDAGALLTARANAELDRPLRVFTPPNRIVEEVDLEALLEDLEPALFVLRRLFVGLEARLEARGLAASSVLLRFVVEPDLSRPLDDGSPRPRSSKMIVPLALAFARPTRRAATMLAVAREKLGSALPGAIRAVTAEALGPAADHGAQLDLFSAHAQQVEEVAELLGRLRAALGDQAVFSPEILDRHRPESAWRIRPFDLNAALELPKVEKPKVELAAPTLTDEAPPRAPSPLPVVDATLQVALPPEPAQMRAAQAQSDAPAKAWPKPVKPAADELVPPLPPRPLELFEQPEEVAFSGSNGLDEGTLLWRGARLPVVAFFGRERLEAEWWTSAPVEREYAVAEVADGRRLWIYFAPGGRTFVHGVFD